MSTEEYAMTAPTKRQAILATPTIAPFLSRDQLSAIIAACRGEEKEFFMQKIIDLAHIIKTMPVTYQQDGMGDSAVVYLHYFLGGNDWYITEKDKDGGVQQAFGYASLNGGEGELGYISIKEIVAHDIDLDLYFVPCTLAEVKAKHGEVEIPW